jgi:S1-C subfamily serine protease
LNRFSQTRFNEFRQPEIQNLRVSITGDHDVLGLDVAMHDASGKRATDLNGGIALHLSFLDLLQPAGLLVQRVAEGSPAWREGLLAGTLHASVEGTDILLGGDIILEVNNIPFTDGETAFDKMSVTLNSLKPGDKLTSKVLRAGKVIELSTTITGT